MSGTLRPMNIAKIVAMQHDYRVENSETPLIAINPHSVHIHENGMQQIAPLSEWTINIDVTRPNDDKKYFRHHIVKDGLEWFAITYEPIAVPEAEHAA